MNSNVWKVLKNCFLKWNIQVQNKFIKTGRDNLLVFNYTQIDIHETFQVVELNLVRLQCFAMQILVQWLLGRVGHNIELSSAYISLLKNIYIYTEVLGARQI